MCFACRHIVRVAQGGRAADVHQDRVVLRHRRRADAQVELHAAVADAGQTTLYLKFSYNLCAFALLVSNILSINSASGIFE